MLIGFLFLAFLDSGPMNDSWVRGELRTYEVRQEAADALTHGAFLASVRTVAVDPELCRPIRASDPFCQPTVRAWPMLADAWPDRPRTVYEKIDRDRLMTVALIMQQAPDEPSAIDDFRWMLQNDSP